MTLEAPAEPVTRGPLDGVKVVEVGVWHAGPGAGAMFADLGAEVVKIEGLSGDPERVAGGVGPLLGASARHGKDNWTVLYEISNRGKQGACVDLSNPESREILSRLVAEADIFLTNLREPAQVRFGIDYDSVRAINPQIVFTDVSGYGRKGPLAQMGGFDGAGQAVSGMMYTSGAREPSYMQVILLDQLTAIIASHAAITALFQRERTGVGQRVETSLYASAVYFQYANIFATSITGAPLDLEWDRSKNPPLRTTWQCGDGRWMMAANSPETKYWPSFCAVIGRPELLHDPRFGTSQDRLDNIIELFAILDPIMLGKTRDEWVAIFTAADLIFMPINTNTDVLEDEQALANGYIVDFDLPGVGTMKIPGYPVNFSEATAVTRSPAPALGEHTGDVLRAIGYDDATIEDLRSRNVVR